jgi:hypothetical protein
MDRDFTLQKYRQLCSAVVDNYETATISSFLENPIDECIILRHDVDRSPRQALKMAEIENGYGIFSTYYFRMHDGVFVPEIIKEISKLNHEIGYHYEVLDKSEGDLERAIEIFEKELAGFRKIVDIRTVSMHGGNLFTPWLNEDVWQRYDFRRYGIIGDASLSLDFEEIRYLSDTGRTWRNRYSVKDNPGFNSLDISNTDELIELIERKKFSKICILTHPNRWVDEPLHWFKELIFQHIKNIGKYGLIKYKKGDHGGVGR